MAYRSTLIMEKPSQCLILSLKSYQEAEAQLKRLGLELQVVDTGYIKTLPADCILEQTPKGGERVKSGRIIYVTTQLF